jgi:hypothetical protein
MRRIIGVSALILICAGSCYSQNAPSKTQLTDWSNARPCTEYLPKNTPCKVQISMETVSNSPSLAPSQADITLTPGGSATVILTHASPLMSCSLASSPAVLTRDASSSITTFLATIAGIGALAANPPVAPTEEALAVYENPAPTIPGVSSPAAEDAEEIDGELRSVATDTKSLRQEYQDALGHYAVARLTILANWKYSYPDDAAFSQAAAKLFAAIGRALEDPLPSSDDEKSLKKSIETVQNALKDFKTKYSDSSGQVNPPECKSDPACIQKFQSWFNAAEDRLGRLQSSVKSLLGQLPVQVQVLSDTQTVLKSAYTWLSWVSTPPASGKFVPDPKHPWTTVYLPMTRYAQKQVSEAITCKDVLTQVQVFDSVTFTAYYEPAASWDLSAGAFISLVPGHQVGTVSGPLPAAATMLAVTSSSAVQFIPGAVFEVHPSSLHMNFVCPWAKNEEGTGYHPWGYVCSAGPAVGFLVNPNNGTTSAEFFEGISFGIQRLAILIGNHTGRFQQFTDGYEIGQTVPSGTMPPTNRKWTNHPALGISYRIPIR